MKARHIGFTILITVVASIAFRLYAQYMLDNAVVVAAGSH